MGGGGAPPPPPAQQQLSQTSEFPEELKPYITDILERSKTRMEARDAEGYIPYPAPRLAEFTPEQLEAQTGIAGLARTGLASDPTLASSRTYMQPALDATQASLGQFDTAAAQQYMSPYMQSVIDIQKREAMRSGDVQRQEIGKQAVGAGGFGGSRQAIAEAEQRRNEAQLLNDIQAKGQQSAFEQASAQFERQRGRELEGGQQLAALGEQAPRLALAELGALSGVGAAQQEQGQRALDIGYQQFQEELQYPERTLQEYSSIIRGFPLTPNQFDVKQTATPPPNLATQLVGLAGAGIAGARAFADGGQIKRKAGGLADLPTKRYVKKQEAGSVGEDILLGRRGQNAALQSYLQGIEGLKAESTSLKEQRAALREQQKEDIGRDKFLQLAMAGLQIAEAGGQGKGLLDASIPAAETALGGLGEARTRERELEAANVEAGFQDKMMELGLTEKQIKAISEARTMDAQDLEVKAKLIAAGKKGKDYELPSQNDIKIIGDLSSLLVSGIKDENKKDKLEALIKDTEISNELSILAKNYIKVNGLSPEEAVARSLNDINERYDYEGKILGIPYTSSINRKY
jgi:hypothetical protein